MPLTATKKEITKLQKKAEQQEVLQLPKEQQGLIASLIKSRDKQEKEIGKLKKKVKGQETRIENLTQIALDAKQMAAAAAINNTHTLLAADGGQEGF